MNKRQINDRILILCSGLGQYLYAKALVRQLAQDQQQAIEIKQCFGLTGNLSVLMNEALRKIKHAMSERNPYKIVWLFFDRVNSVNDQNVFSTMQQKMFCLAYTPFCLEYWLLLHFEDCDRFVSSEDGIQKINRIWPQYEKETGCIFNVLQERLEAAVKRVVNIADSDTGFQYMPSPLFTVHKLIAFIDQLKR